MELSINGMGGTVSARVRTVEKEAMRKKIVFIAGLKKKVVLLEKVVSSKESLSTRIEVH